MGVLFRSKKRRFMNVYCNHSFFPLARSIILHPARLYSCFLTSVFRFASYEHIHTWPSAIIFRPDKENQGWFLNESFILHRSEEQDATVRTTCTKITPRETSFREYERSYCYI